MHLDVNAASTLTGPGVEWRNVSIGIENAAHLFVKYQGREISDGSGRQELYSIHLLPRAGAKPLQALSFPKEISEDLQATYTRITQRDGEAPSVGIIVHIDNDHNQFCLGAVEPKTLAEMVKKLISELESTTKIKLYSCRVENTEGKGVNLNQAFLAYLNDPPQPIRESAFPSTVWIGENVDTPGQTWVEQGGEKEPGGRYKAFFYIAPHSESILSDISKYSDNRRRRQFKDSYPIVQRDLATAFQAKVKRKRPGTSVQGLRVVLKTKEEIYLDGTENGTKPGTALKINPSEITGATFDDIKEGDRLDLLVIPKTHTGPRPESFIRVAPLGKFTAAEIESEIPVGRLRSLQTKITALRDRLEKIDLKIDQNIDPEVDVKEADRGNSASSSDVESRTDSSATDPELQVKAMQELQEELGMATSGIEELQAELSTSPAEFSDSALTRMEQHLKSLDEKLAREERRVHKQLYKRFLAIRKNQDKNLLSLAHLSERLNLHHVDVTDEVDKSDVKEMQRQVLELYAEFREGRDEVDRLAKKLVFDKDDAVSITELKAALPDEVHLESPIRIEEMKKRVNLFLSEKKRDQLLRWQKLIPTVQTQLEQLKETVTHAPIYLRNTINHWMQGVAKTLESMKALQVGVTSTHLAFAWGVTQVRVNDGAHKLTLLQQRINALIKGIQSQQLAQRDLEDKVDKGWDAFRRQSKFGAEFVEAANSTTSVVCARDSPSHTKQTDRNNRCNACRYCVAWTNRAIIFGIQANARGPRKCSYLAPDRKWNESFRGISNM